MRASRLTTTVATAILAALVSLPLVVLAANVGDLVTLASGAPYTMGCTPDATGVTCSKTQTFGFWTARITPKTGPEDTLQTSDQTSLTPMDAFTRGWMVDMHQTACGDAAGVTAFITTVGALPPAARRGRQ